MTTFDKGKSKQFHVEEDVKKLCLGRTQAYCVTMTERQLCNYNDRHHDNMSGTRKDTSTIFNASNEIVSKKLFPIIIDKADQKKKIRKKQKKILCVQLQAKKSLVEHEQHFYIH